MNQSDFESEVSRPYSGDESLLFAAIKTVVYDDVRKKIIEFNDDNTIQLFWENCDTNQDDQLDFDEYVVCRGDFDKQGNMYEINEYTARETMIIFDYEESRSSSKIQPHLKYDENGIIID